MAIFETIRDCIARASKENKVLEEHGTPNTLAASIVFAGDPRLCRFELEPHSSDEMFIRMMVHVVDLSPEQAAQFVEFLSSSEILQMPIEASEDGQLSWVSDTLVTEDPSVDTVLIERWFEVIDSDLCELDLLVEETCSPLKQKAPYLKLVRSGEDP